MNPFPDSLPRGCLLLLLLLPLALSPALQAQEDEDDFFIFDEEDDDSDSIEDPFEGFNRAMFGFNDALYRGVLKPVARGLRVVPQPARVGAANFFDNLDGPISAFNALLQGDLPNAGTEASRFVINTTIGILGLFDPAADMGIAKDNEDFGQTLARWGVDHGPYLVLPFFGGSSLRDGTGRIIHAYMNPVNWDLHADGVLAITLVEAEVDLSLDQDTYEALYDSALDPYIFFRSAYVQNRAGSVEE